MKALFIAIVFAVVAMLFWQNSGDIKQFMNPLNSADTARGKLLISATDPLSLLEDRNMGYVKLSKFKELIKSAGFRDSTILGDGNNDSLQIIIDSDFDFDRDRIFGREFDRIKGLRNLPIKIEVNNNTVSFTAEIVSFEEDDLKCIKIPWHILFSLKVSALDRVQRSASQNVDENRRRVANVPAQEQTHSSLPPAPPAPLTPQNFRIIEIGFNNVRLAWNNAGENVTYRVYWDTLPALNNARSRVFTGTAAIIDTLKPEQKYYFWIASLRGEQSSLRAKDSATTRQQTNAQRAFEHNSRGIHYYREGNFTRAIEEHREAILYDFNNANYHYWRGRAYERIGRNVMAIENYRNALNINHNFQPAQRGLARLQRR